ncbi:hypothetical protein ACFL35_11890 [Candidatus Riflebacteria bacterium]
MPETRFDFNPWWNEYLFFIFFESIVFPLFFIIYLTPFIVSYWYLTNLLQDILLTTGLSFLFGAMVYFALDWQGKPGNLKIFLFSLLTTAIFALVIFFWGIQPQFCLAFSLSNFLAVITFFKLWPMEQRNPDKVVLPPRAANLWKFKKWKMRFTETDYFPPKGELLSKHYLWYILKLSLFYLIPSLVILAFFSYPAFFTFVQVQFPKAVIFHHFLPVFFCLLFFAFFHNLISDYFHFTPFLVRLVIGLLIVWLMFFLLFHRLWEPFAQTVQYFCFFSVFMGTLLVNQVSNFVYINAIYPRPPKDAVAQETEPDEADPLLEPDYPIKKESRKIFTVFRYILSTLSFAILYLLPFIILSHFFPILIPIVTPEAIVPSTKIWILAQSCAFFVALANILFCDFFEMETPLFRILFGLFFAMLFFKYLLGIYFKGAIHSAIYFLLNVTIIIGNVLLAYLDSSKFYYEMKNKLSSTSKEKEREELRKPLTAF